MSQVIEHAVVFGPKRGLVGVLTSPGQGQARSDLPDFIVLNTGFVHRTGPSRLSVTLARRLVESGVRVLRFDFSGIGDSLSTDSTAPFLERAAFETREAMDFLMRSEGAERFVVVGLCTGANIAFDVARCDSRIVGAVLVNGVLLAPEVTDPMLRHAGARAQARYYRSRLFDPKSWARFLRGKSDVKALRRTLLACFRSRDQEDERRAGSELLTELQRLGDRGVELLAVYSEGSDAWDLITILLGPGAKGLDQLRNLHLEFIEDADHLFAPSIARQRLLGLVWDWSTSSGRWMGRDTRASVRRRSTDAL